MYYNTTNETGERLKKSRKSAQSGAEIVYEIIAKHKRRPMTRDEVLDAVVELYGFEMDRVSCGRALTDLATDGRLVHLPSIKRPGKRGKQQTCYAPKPAGDLFADHWDPMQGGLR